MMRKLKIKIRVFGELECNFCTNWLFLKNKKKYLEDMYALSPNEVVGRGTVMLFHKPLPFNSPLGKLLVKEIYVNTWTNTCKLLLEDNK